VPEPRPTFRPTRTKRVADQARAALLGAFHAMNLDVRIRSKHRLPFVDVLHGQGVQVVLDVGANTGQFAARLRKEGFGARIVSFEPASWAFAELKRRAQGDPLWQCMNLALGDSEHEDTLRLSANSVSSSLLSMDERHRRAAPRSAYIGEEKVRVATLDSLRSQLLASGESAALKLDTQGFEMKVLAGAKATLGQVRAVHAEMSVTLLYEGQGYMHEIMAHLYDAGFELVNLSDEWVEPRTRFVLAFDGIFIRR
jgi:FkbM family methyltransferase